MPRLVPTTSSSIDENVANSSDGSIAHSSDASASTHSDLPIHTSGSQQQHHLAHRLTHHVDDEEEEEEEEEEEDTLYNPSRDEDEGPPSASPSPPPTFGKQDDPGSVTWRDLPQKSQLAILTLARLSEPLTQTSLQAYMFYQLQSFDPSLPTSTITAQAGILQATFTAAQFVTAVMWGRIADAEWGGRKRVLLVGVAGTGVSCVGFGFSRTFWQTMVWRTLGGALNGNVGVIRTMISEIVKEKRFQSRAFLLLPMCFNIGTSDACLLRFVADGNCRRYYRTSLGWTAVRSCE